MAKNTDQMDTMIYKELLEADIAEDENAYELAMKKVDKLVGLRKEISVPKQEESNKRAIISGAVQIASILVVLQYEKSNVVTSKVYSMAANMFKGS